MISFEQLQSELKKGDIKNTYIFCGSDEVLIKESVELIKKNVLNKDFIDLNFMKFDGAKVQMMDLENACETMPFMSDKKVVLIYRAGFLSDNKNKKSGSDSIVSENIFKEISKYIEDIPSHCVLIMYYVYDNDREKLSSKIKKLGNKVVVGEFNKLKGVQLEKRIKNLFEERGKDIGKTELGLFTTLVDNDMEVVVNEVEKLCCYTMERDIKKEDITLLLPPKSDNDIFNLVDYISEKKPEKALDILNELIYRGEKVPRILSMIERQFKLLFTLKSGAGIGKGKEQLASELRLHPYICEKMIAQSRKFTTAQLKNAMECCLNTEKTLKSESVDDKTVLEILLVDTLRK